VEKVFPNGDKKTYNSAGQLHSFNNEPAVIFASGAVAWYENGLVHRGNNEPAIVCNENKYWYENGVYHRGNNEPAIIYSNGAMEWYKNGVKYTLPKRAKNGE
jgi:hypothetical protein